jgi:hypothetical protein
MSGVFPAATDSYQPNTLHLLLPAAAAQEGLWLTPKPKLRFMHKNVPSQARPLTNSAHKSVSSLHTRIQNPSWQRQTAREFSAKTIEHRERQDEEIRQVYQTLPATFERARVLTSR